VLFLYTKQTVVLGSGHNQSEAFVRRRLTRSVAPYNNSSGQVFIVQLISAVDAALRFLHCCHLSVCSNVVQCRSLSSCCFSTLCYTGSS